MKKIIEETVLTKEKVFEYFQAVTVGKIWQEGNNTLNELNRKIKLLKG